MNYEELGSTYPNETMILSAVSKTVVLNNAFNLNAESGFTLCNGPWTIGIDADRA